MKTEEQWRKEEDAHTLARAEEIKADRSRLAGAQQAAKAMLAEEQKRRESMAKVAGVKAAGKTQSQDTLKVYHTTGKVVDLSGKIGGL